MIINPIAEPPAPPAGFRITRVCTTMHRSRMYGGNTAKQLVEVINEAFAEDLIVYAMAWNDVTGEEQRAIYDIAKGEWSTWSFDNL